MSDFHVCEVRGPRCEMVNGSFLDYNRPPHTSDGRLACGHCKSDVDRGGVDAATDLIYPGLKSFLADRRKASATPTETHHDVPAAVVRNAGLRYPVRLTAKLWRALYAKADAVASPAMPDAKNGRNDIVAHTVKLAAVIINRDPGADRWFQRTSPVGTLSATRDVVDGVMTYTIGLYS